MAAVATVEGMALPATPALRLGGDVRRAWLAVAAFPVVLLLVMLLGDGLLGAFGYGVRDPVIPPTVRVTVGLPLTALAVTPGLAAWRFGTRARLAGDPHGRLPAILGRLLAFGFVALNGITASIGW